jgi:hypothetical protein
MKSGKLKSGLEKLNIPKPTRANPFLRDIVCLRVCGKEVYGFLRIQDI